PNHENMAFQGSRCRQGVGRRVRFPDRVRIKETLICIEAARRWAFITLHGTSLLPIAEEKSDASDNTYTHAVAKLLECVRSPPLSANPPLSTETNERRL